MNTLIVFSTNYGATEKVSAMLSKKINGNIEVRNVANVKDLNLNNFDNIVIGASIKIGQIQKVMKDWLSLQKDTLLKKNIYFFLCAGEIDSAKRNEFWNANYPKELLDSSKKKIWAGSEINLDRMGFLSKIFIKKVLGQKENSSKLQLEDIDSLAKAINSK